MNMLSKVNKYAILAGDFNLNLLKINEGTAAGSFVDSFVSFGHHHRKVRMALAFQRRSI